MWEKGTRALKRSSGNVLTDTAKSVNSLESFKISRKVGMDPNTNVISAQIRFSAHCILMNFKYTDTFLLHSHVFTCRNWRQIVVEEISD